MEPKAIETKIIVIKTNGPIIPKGGVYGPTTPYKEKVSEIAVLLRNHYAVYEQLSNGEEVKLDLLNYDQDLNADNGEAADKLPDPVVIPVPFEVKGKEEKKEDVKTDTKPVQQPAQQPGKQQNVASTTVNKADDLTSK